VILWETRMGTARFDVVEGPYALGRGHGLRLVREVAAASHLGRRAGACSANPDRASTRRAAS
jgi:hypothetical protein